MAIPNASASMIGQKAAAYSEIGEVTAAMGKKMALPISGPETHEIEAMKPSSFLKK